MSVLIIAEAGVNHNGDINLAKSLIKAAADSGADYVKFQTFVTELNIAKDAIKAEYQLKTTDSFESQFEMVKKLELSFENFRDLNRYCKECGIKFLSTGFDLPSVDFLESLEIDFFKIPSGEITNKPFLEYIGKKNKPVVLSTGMSTLQEISDAMAVLIKSGLAKEEITVLHCNTEYPTPFEDVNLHAMKTIEKELGVSIGYSDHTVGIEVPIAAVALGAIVIEKHFTLDRALPGPDHKASLQPSELSQMIKAIRNIELALSGSGLKEPSNSEIANIKVIRKSLHYRSDIKKGERLTANNFICIRPGDGISPMQIDTVAGRILKNDVQAFTKVEAKDFE